MNKSNAYLSVLLAGLLATAGVQAQSTPAAGSSDLPPKAGEASTQTMGAPNAATTNSPATEVPISTKDAIRQDAHGMSGASATSSVPPKAGEASTSVQGKPNADPASPMVGKSRAEVKAEIGMNRAQVDAARAGQSMGNTRYGVPVGTPATAPAGTPSVFQGGTPQ
ncbi:hypothetical protein [Caenimonas soli]|uniref:hypothetical protein n=1 Tax=Caenimonas soli TaxID=2735555 RepID=UPI001556B68F|nr:hypothetical protein [Caenimonas soli]NPC55217.1 hypothetical protein [Caenimonas soli]